MRLLLLAFGFLALAWSGFQPSPAAAHAQLQATIPAAGSVLPQAPQEVRLTFSEPVAPLVLRWIAPDGREMEIGRAPGRESVCQYVSTAGGAVSLKKKKTQQVTT